MSGLRIDLPYLLDRTAIQEVQQRYFRGLDRGDRAMVRSCFTADVDVSFHGLPPVRGVDALLGTLLAELFHAAQHGIGNVGYHLMGQMDLVRLEGDAATTETHAISAKVRGATAGVTSGSTVTLRGLRYLDRLVRTPEGWLISERRHVLDWMADAPAGFAAALAQRVHDLPAPVPAGADPPSAARSHPDLAPPAS